MMRITIIALTALLIFQISKPTSCHRLITNPYASSEWDSLVLSSNPIRIRESKQNKTISTKKPLRSNGILQTQKRSFNECPENDFECLYGNNEGEKKYYPDKLIEYSDSPSLNSEIEKLEENSSTNKDSESSRKSYWNVVPTQENTHHLYDDKKWVTLEPIPWSTSKISKWHPNVEVYKPNQPWDFVTTTQKPVHQFWVSGSSYRPQKPNTHWGIGTNDIITDNKPSGFPSGGVNNYPPQSLNHHQSQNVYYSYSGQFPDRPESQRYTDIHQTYQSRFPGSSHPSTYPSNGNGEWVLLSTKKGYSQTHRWPGKSDHSKAGDRIFSSRKLKPVELSRYHEENLDSKPLFDKGNELKNQKITSNLISFAKPLKNSTSDEKTSIPLKVLYPESLKGDEPAKPGTRKVRLQVLPALGGNSLSHGGLLEVDSNPQTVEEALEEAKIKKLQSIANVKRNKITGFKLIPNTQVTGKGAAGSQNALTVAAVGAGMIPATMAVLLPMIFGRSKRSLPDNQDKRNAWLWPPTQVSK